MEDKIIITQFAPVIIPTLCRFLHFKNCLESLAACTHADKTDVFIGLDYPTKDQHWEGYNKINEFLLRLENSNPFHKLEVIRRDRNYGFGEFGNAALLRKYVLENYDSIIFTEDDNIFSPAFLDYINKGLIKFKDNKEILAICGYRHFYNLKFDKNSFILQDTDFNAWGYGIWKDRIDEYSKINREWFKQKLSLKKFLHIKNKYGNLRALHFLQFATDRNPDFRITDIVLSLYLALDNRFVVMPKESLVRNTGFDKSGESFKDLNDSISNKYIKQKISNQTTFEYIGTGYENYDNNIKAFIKDNPYNIPDIKFPSSILKTFIKNLIN